MVIIGRNEGARLARCLDAVPGGSAVVYVDSGSTDGSSALARARGATVVALDLAQPFTAARARNTGFAEVRSLQPDVELVQFLDGDCELVPGWLEEGARLLRADARMAAVSGRVRERERERSRYNRLCDLEWRAAPGPALMVGGNAMMRAAAFHQAGGFDPDLIAGEEPELCVRLRRDGWGIFRTDRDMVLHDAAMTRFGQWWRRAVRAGWAFAEGAARHGAPPERHWVRERNSIAFWGLVVPGLALALAWPTRGASLLLLAGLPALVWRVHRWAVRDGVARRDARLLAAFTVLAKFPQAVGLLQYLAFRALGRRRRLVDWRVAG